MPSVYPIVVYPLNYQGAFPNMAKRDEAVWRRFLAAHGERFVGFAYNVALGGVKLVRLDDDPQLVVAWQYQTALKIDVVALAADAAWVIEVKPDAHVSALGAAICYALVTEREQIFDRPVKSAVVAEYVQPDVKWCADRLGVAVYIV